MCELVVQHVVCPLYSEKGLILSHIVTKCFALVDSSYCEEVLILFGVEIALNVVDVLVWVWPRSWRLFVKHVVQKSASKFVIPLQFNFDGLNLVELALGVKLALDHYVIVGVDNIRFLDVEVFDQVLDHPTQRDVVITEFFITNFDVELYNRLIIINVYEGV